MRDFMNAYVRFIFNRLNFIWNIMMIFFFYQNLTISILYYFQNEIYIRTDEDVEKGIFAVFVIYEDDVLEVINALNLYKNTIALSK
ncbi:MULTISPECIES: hypothetical protein [unclassified Bacillus (in: firmicutes)]|uniref:hypothetical protein n=1 Tax=unclassified Bacillus (in: firmicutes) TaxID=185979 RepID=UPI001BE8711F|nr:MULTISPECIES: hypothetical protein [unclassified Bacillus (in: firmicutes)]MBT2616373.1 hypothetical protein [Bacillus sp. ISL-78]MBT2630020.1 hypothetical protein [Bacillus sp. ISL-101]